MKTTKSNFLLRTISGVIISASLLTSAFAGGYHHNVRESVIQHYR